MSAKSQPCLILAGGESRRMGEDKAGLLVGEQRLIDLQIKSLKSNSELIYISANHDFGTDFPFIPDLKDGARGPVAALFAAFRQFNPNEELTGFFTIPVDAPLFPNDLFEQLYDVDRSAIASNEARVHPTFAWWRLADLKNVFEGSVLDGKISLTRLSEMVNVKTVVWKDTKLFFNINDPNDLNTYLTLISPPHKEC